MQYNKSLILMLAAAAASVRANDVTPLPADTSRVIDIEETVVVASPKETQTLRRQAVSVSILGEQRLADFDVRSVRGLSGVVPNFYSPDYGSRLSSAIYVRGIGSRINSPAVGLYVDNIPYVDKTAYDFRFQNVDRIDVLRGPQGTIYGRNSMAGLMRVFTKDPLTYKGTEVNLGASGRNNGLKADFTTFLHPAQNLGLSVGGFYDYSEGYFKSSDKQDVDYLHTAGGNVRAVWKPADALRLGLSVNYEYVDQGANPYFYEGPAEAGAVDEYPDERGSISYTYRPYYRRNLWNNGLSVEWTAPSFVLSSNTSFQYLDDRLSIDQDFLKADIFRLIQQQAQRNLTEEFTLRSHRGRRWLWTSGAFVSYQHLNTSCPVRFGADGMDYLNGQISGGMSQSGMPMSLELSDGQLMFTSQFRTPSVNAALFHQSTFRHLGVEGLSATVGLRLDYDHQQLTLDAATSDAVPYNFRMPAFQVDASESVSPQVKGSLSDHYWQLLPKFALQYDLPEALGNVYASVSKGYRSGGYNIQQYSDLAQAALTRDLMSSVADLSEATISAIPGMPQAVKDKAIAAMREAISQYMPAEPQAADLRFKPEKSWNYEVGAHLNLADHALRLDAAAFCTLTKDQQIARFSPSGLGRMTVNAGESRSCGAELGLTWAALDNRLMMMANYGFTHATFTFYDAGEQVVTDENGESQRVHVDYTGNRVPFAPAHTLGASADFTQPLNRGLWRSVTVGLNVSGCGDIYWNEQNSMRQKFYALMGAHVGGQLGSWLHFDFWAKNITNTHYDLFRFDSMDRRFSQRGLPAQAGFDLKFQF